MGTSAKPNSTPRLYLVTVTHPNGEVEQVVTKVCQNWQATQAVSEDIQTRETYDRRTAISAKQCTIKAAL